MEDLRTMRSRIDEIDKEIAILLDRRMKISNEIGKIKKETNSSIENVDREKELIFNNLKFISAEYKNYYVEIENKILEISKKIQL